MLKRVAFILSILLIFSHLAFAQVGGRTVYNFLDFSHSARLSALGGNLISVRDDDASLLLYNPSSINRSFHTALAANFTDYFTNAAYGTATYSHTFEKAGSFAFGINYVGYGKMLKTDEWGAELGYFHAGDLALIAGWGRQLDSAFSIGANFKFIYSGYESYHSVGIAVDVAGSYYNKDKDISLTLLVKNLGTELKPYVSGNYERLPFDIQFAFSHRLKHLPVRYHISLHSLYRWNLAYVGENDPLLEKDGLTKEYKYPSKAAQFFDNFFRHFVFGIEVIPVKYLSFQFAYNHQRHQEMTIPQARTFAGFSYGISLNIKGLQFGFSRAHFAAGAVPNYFTFSANIDELSKMSHARKARKLQKVARHD